MHYLRVTTTKGVHRVPCTVAERPTFINIPAGVIVPGHPDFVDLCVRVEPHVMGAVMSIEYRRE